MSEMSAKLLAGTTKPAGAPALVVLEDGRAFRGTSCGARGEVFGEICFNTTLEGYLEVLTDPSYAGQIVTMTYPQIGNYGVCRDDIQSARPALSGFIVRDLCRTPSNFRSDLSLPEYLEEQGIVAVEDIDTRALVRHVRDAGAMRAAISTECLDEAQLLQRVRQSRSLVGANLVRDVSPNCAPHDGAGRTAGTDAAALHVVAIDCGMKESIRQQLQQAGCAVQVMPWDVPADEVLALQPDGVFLSNGPGDPDAVQQTYATAAALMGKVPLFGICLGHQMLARAAGASIEKLPFGHHGGNQPVMNLLEKRVEVTVQNHGFGIVFDSLGQPDPQSAALGLAFKGDLRPWAHAGVAPVVCNPRFGRVRLTHVNLNDGTPEGIEFLDIPAFSVQYHPEASPGPHDSRYLFEKFVALMRGAH